VEKDALGERGRALEEEYFRKRDRELVERLRNAGAEGAAREAMGKATGLSDPELLKELQSLGFTPDTVILLPLMPVLQVAWAEGGVTSGERKALLELARTRGIVEGTAADRQLAAWMDQRPSDDVFAGAGRLIRALIDANSSTMGHLNADDLVHYAEMIAGASGGILGFGRISAEEKSLLANIAAELKGRRS
jgi:hypothetical protein